MAACSGIGYRVSGIGIKFRYPIPDRRYAFVLAVVLAMLAPLTLAQTRAAATQPAGRPWELLSYGSGEHFWYAVTTPADSSDPQPRTFVFERELFKDEWQELTEGFPGRLIAMGDLRGQLIASLQGGEWEL